MQAIARVTEHFVHAPTIEALEVGGKTGTDLIGGQPFLSGGQLIALTDVLALQPTQCFHGVMQARGGHAPGTDRCTDQVDGLIRTHQPVSKQEAVQRAEDQPFGSSGRAGHGANVTRHQTMIPDVLAGLGARKKAKRLHGLRL